MIDCEKIFNEAREAAHDRASKLLAEHGDVGACGFAWVKVRPARGSFVTWCKKQAALAANNREAQKFGETDQYNGGGYEFWNPSDSRVQSVFILSEGAKAFAEVLNSYGIKASHYSRLD